MTLRKKLIAGNWKMNGLVSTLGEIVAMREHLQISKPVGLETLICPPALLLARAAELAQDSPLKIGGQDCYFGEFGAHTGDISAPMLRDAGASHVILGHSERRANHGETDAIVRAKAVAALAAGLQIIICIGETQSERAAAHELAIVGAQLAGSVPHGCKASELIIAYEPVWAIGTGLTPSEEDVAQMHAFLRSELTKALFSQAEGVRILYGGSVKPNNARTLLSVDNVDGALVGGASLKCHDFMAIVDAVKH